MKLKTIFHLALISLLMCASGLKESKAQDSAGTYFKGSVAGAKVEMTLRREGDQLQGSYFYTKSGRANPLSLRVNPAA